MNDCHEDADCIEESGSYSCLCQNGYRQNGTGAEGTDCVDIDQCRHGLKEKKIILNNIILLLTPTLSGSDFVYAVGMTVHAAILLFFFVKG